MKNARILSFLLILCITQIFSQVKISGNIGGMVFEKSSSPFIVTGDVKIPSGMNVTIHEGCIFLFKSYTGIIIEGNFSVEGSAENPVVFTSFNDPKHNPTSKQEPDFFDWNGIYISQKARDVKISNFIIKYSVYGIKSQKYEIIIHKGKFCKNGQFNFTINDEIQPVIENALFNFGQIRETSIPIRKNYSIANLRKPVAIATSIMGLISFGVMGYFLDQKSDYKTKYEKTEYQPDMNRYIKKQEDFRSYAIISGGTSSAILATGVVLFLIDPHEDRKKNVMVKPFYYKGIGVLSKVNF